eukprot:SAG31_NODE_2457_length_5661_cov_94.571557_2_plen_99_part_00
MDQSNRNINRGNKNVNINLNNKIILSRQKANLREVRRGLRGTASLKGVSTFNVPQTQSALLNNIMMSQFNNFGIGTRATSNVVNCKPKEWRLSSVRNN